MFSLLSFLLFIPIVQISFEEEMCIWKTLPAVSEINVYDIKINGFQKNVAENYFFAVIHLELAHLTIAVSFMCVP